MTGKLLQTKTVKRLYDQLIKEAEKFPQYNYRMYALRKIRDEFEAKQDLPKAKMSEFLIEGKNELERLKRMTVVASLYAGAKLVIEQAKGDEQLAKEQVKVDGKPTKGRKKIGDKIVLDQDGAETKQ